MGADADAESQFGPYLVYERLGVGGMATVHRALERGIEGFERIVALKRLLPHLAEDATFIKSFVREAKLASILHHVNVVQIYELGRVGTEYFISMEYIDGRDVRRILRHARRATGAPPMHVTVGLMTQLCDALDYAHNKTDDDGRPLGLVHRDVSPSNLLVTTQGHLKVIDFGIAKAQSTGLRTQTGRVKGKLAYMAPEAIGGRELDSRSDLFAAGVIAHELLTARPLFASKNEYQTLLKVQRGEILPPSAFNQAVPPELDRVVLKALAREPDERYPTAAALREDLNAVRRQYKLQAGFRDVAKWIDWAFTMEAPAGFAVGATIDQTGSAFRVTPAVRTPTPRPRQSDEDMAVEIAWGGDGDGGDGGPVVLDDVPDVSEKHLAATGIGALSALDDDDIPAHTPSHGALGSSSDVLGKLKSGDGDGDEPMSAASTGRMAAARDGRDNRPSSSSQQLREAQSAALALAEAAALVDDPTGRRGAAPDKTEPALARAPDDGSLIDDDGVVPPPVADQTRQIRPSPAPGARQAAAPPLAPPPRPTPPVRAPSASSPPIAKRDGRDSGPQARLRDDAGARDAAADARELITREVAMRDERDATAREAAAATRDAAGRDAAALRDAVARDAAAARDAASRSEDLSIDIDLRDSEPSLADARAPASQLGANPPTLAGTGSFARAQSGSTPPPGAGPSARSQTPSAPPANPSASTLFPPSSTSPGARAPASASSPPAIARVASASLPPTAPMGARPTIAPPPPPPDAAPPRPASASVPPGTQPGASGVRARPATAPGASPARPATTSIPPGTQPGASAARPATTSIPPGTQPGASGARPATTSVPPGTQPGVRSSPVIAPDTAAIAGAALGPAPSPFSAPAGTGTTPRPGSPSAPPSASGSQPPATLTAPSPFAGPAARTKPTSQPPQRITPLTPLTPPTIEAFTPITAPSATQTPTDPIRAVAHASVPPIADPSDPPTSIRIDAVDSPPRTEMPPGVVYARGPRPNRRARTSSAAPKQKLRARTSSAQPSAAAIAAANAPANLAPIIPSSPDAARTQPGMQAHARRPAAASGDDGAELATTGRHRARPTRVSHEQPAIAGSGAGLGTIGASMLQQRQRPTRWWLPIGALLLVAGGAALYLYVIRDDGSPTARSTTPTPAPAPPTRTAPTQSGNVKFVTEPAGAEIAIEGKLVHTGTPWATDLAVGPHAVEIRQAGFKAWLTSIDVEPNRDQLVRVALEPLGTAVAADATLTITTAPPGLEVAIDNHPMPERTPIKTTLAPGNHVLVLKRGGVEVWRQEVEAHASAVYEFNPAFPDHRVAPPVGPRPQLTDRPAPADPTPSEPGSDAAGSAIADLPPNEPPPSPGSDTAAPVMQPAPPVIPPPPPVTPPPPPPQQAQPPPRQAAPTAPINVSASAVTKVSGSPPNIAKGRYDDDLPSVIVAKVCIDTTGKVAAATVVTRLGSSRIAQDIVDALEAWRYAPYKRNGTPTPACFFVSMRTRS
jgi:serine/threonine protein kinase|nr:protein kinase [Kofleriaceae bacterium]